MRTSRQLRYEVAYRFNVRSAKALGRRRAPIDMEVLSNWLEPLQKDCFPSDLALGDMRAATERA